MVSRDGLQDFFALTALTTSVVDPIQQFTKSSISCSETPSIVQSGYSLSYVACIVAFRLAFSSSSCVTGQRHSSELCPCPVTDLDHAYPLSFSLQPGDILRCWRQLHLLPIIADSKVAQDGLVKRISFGHSDLARGGCGCWHWHAGSRRLVNAQFCAESKDFVHMHVDRFSSMSLYVRTTRSAVCFNLDRHSQLRTSSVSQVINWRSSSVKRSKLRS